MTFLSKLFGHNNWIVCPRCLTEIAIPIGKTRPDIDLICSDCKFHIPSNYFQNFDKAYPVFIHLFGWAAVGKTTFLDVLRLMLYIHPLWPKFTCEPITEFDFSHKAILLNQRRNGKLPSSTMARDRNQNEPYIMLLNDMDRWQNRFLVMLEHAGEQFQTFTVPQGEIPFLQHCPTTIMFYSLTDRETGKQIEDLMITYINSLNRYGVDFSKVPRNLVVVLTKGDKITNLPPNLAHYLNTDDTWRKLEHLETPSFLQGAKLSEYIEAMSHVSDALKGWFGKNVPGGRAFQNMADREGIETRFSIISALGQESKLRSDDVWINPKRVLDPLFWALEFQSR